MKNLFQILILFLLLLPCSGQTAYWQGYPEGPPTQPAGNSCSLSAPPVLGTQVTIDAHYCPPRPPRFFTSPSFLFISPTVYAPGEQPLWGAFPWWLALPIQLGASWTSAKCGTSPYRHYLSIPNDPALAGMDVFLQAILVVDANATAQTCATLGGSFRPPNLCTLLIPSEALRLHLGY